MRLQCFVLIWGGISYHIHTFYLVFDVFCFADSIYLVSLFLNLGIWDLNFSYCVHFVLHTAGTGHISLLFSIF